MPKPDTTFNPEIVPPAELEKRTRRTFSAQYKRSIIEQADACKHGELGKLLRREKLYSNQLAQWRRELAEKGEQGLNKTKPGPQASQTPEQKRVAQLEKENARLHKQLKIKDSCIELQKKSLSADRAGRTQEYLEMLINNNPAAMELSQRKACEVLELCRNTLRQQHKTKTLCGPLETPKRSRKHTKQPKALSAAERETVLNTLNSESFCNQPPVEVYHSLLEQGQYLCSVSTMHRILRDSRLNGERRKQRPAQSHCVPRLRATRVHEVWTWDIAKLPTKKRGEYLSLYVILDLYSRRIISWMLSHKENSALSSQLIQSATHQYDIPKHTKQPKALSAAERKMVVNTLNNESFCNQPPVEVYHSLLEQGQRNMTTSITFSTCLRLFEYVTIIVTILFFIEQINP